MMIRQLTRSNKLFSKRAFSTKDIVGYLKEGNKRFLDGKSIVTEASSLANLKNFAANGQTPKTCVLCCSDSRAPVEMIFDADLGELFITRVAGNIAVPALIGSIEYAVATFGSSVIVVLGHTKCGAVKATLDTIESGAPLPSAHLEHIVSTIKPNAMVAAESSGSDTEKMNAAIEANVRGSIDVLTHHSAILGGLIAEKTISIHGAVFDLDTGAIKFL